MSATPNNKAYTSVLTVHSKEMGTKDADFHWSMSSSCLGCILAGIAGPIYASVAQHHHAGIVWRLF